MTQPAPPPPPRSTLHLLGRHQAASLVSTIVDFGTMTTIVEFVGASPALATLVGATAGGVTNFLVGRRVVFASTTSSPYPQAVRYALVSATSAGLNALGVYVLDHGVHVQYLLARMAVAVGVSIAWNFPMQRHFVFRNTSGGIVEG